MGSLYEALSPETFKLPLVCAPRHEPWIPPTATGARPPRYRWQGCMPSATRRLHFHYRYEMATYIKQPGPPEAGTQEEAHDSASANCDFAPAVPIEWKKAVRDGEAPMRGLLKSSIGEINTARPGSRGVTGLETAIVLIAFVVVSSVFAFATLSTGLFSADKSKETIRAGLSETQGTLEVKGSLQLGITTGAVSTSLVSATTSFVLTGDPIIPGSEVLTSGDGSTLLTLGADYTLVYKTGPLPLRTRSIPQTEPLPTRSTPLTALRSTWATPPEASRWT